MEEKEVRIPILGVIDEDKLECHDNMHLFETYPYGNGIYLIKRSGLRASLRNVSKSESKNQNGKNYATWDEFILPTSIVIEDIKKEQEAQLREIIRKGFWDIKNRITGCDASEDNSTENIKTLCKDLHSLRDDLMAQFKLLEEILTQLTETHTQTAENGSASGNGISEKTLLEALAIVTKKV